jgi:hypothetical protein
MQIRAILMRKGDASVIQLRHLRHEDDIRLLTGASSLVPQMRYAYQELYSILVAFRSALPSPIERALSLAVLRLLEFNESVKRLDSETIDKMSESEFAVQLTQNSHLTASVFEALSELLDIVFETTGPVLRKP